jgi:integrase
MARISLPNGCSCSQPNVFPANWKAIGASCKKDWYITYRFYDPAYEQQHPTGKLVMVKGMNGYKTVKDRQVSTAQILKEVLYYLEKGYNPILDAIVEEKKRERTEPILPKDGLWRGIIFARSNKTYTKAGSADVDSYLRRILKVARALDLHTKPLGEFRRRDMMAIFDFMAREKPWTPYTWNNCLGYVRPLFKLLNTYEAMELNPCYGIEKMPVPETTRKVLTDEERKTINEHLRDHHRRFWLFVQMFFHSGAREIELLQVKREDVDVTNQTYWVTIRKGKKKLPKREQKAIKNIAVPYWQEYIEDAGEGDFLFCKGWKAGKKSLSRDWLTHLWEKVVKDGLGIDVDLYTLKHLNYDEIDAKLGADAAAAQASHTSTRMRKHYAVKAKQRELDKVKQLDNAFA